MRRAYLWISLLSEVLATVSLVGCVAFQFFGRMDSAILDMGFACFFKLSAMSARENI